MESFFGSLFGDIFSGRDCSKILNDPKADPMDRHICEAFKEFSTGRPSIDNFIERDTAHTDGPDQRKRPDAHSLRDSILKKDSRHYRRSQVMEDENLDEAIAQGADINDLLRPEEPDQNRSSYSYTRVTITTKPDGSVEEKRVHRDSQGNEHETTIIRGSGQDPTSTPDSGVKKLTDWLWGKH